MNHDKQIEKHQPGKLDINRNGIGFDFRPNTEFQCAQLFH